MKLPKHLEEFLNQDAVDVTKLLQWMAAQKEFEAKMTDSSDNKKDDQFDRTNSNM